MFTLRFRYKHSGCCAIMRTPGRIILLGGRDEEDQNKTMVEEYDIREGKWQTKDFNLPFHFHKSNSYVATISGVGQS